MGLAEVKADCKLERERILGMLAGDIDAKRELTETILPLIEGLVEAVAADNQERDEAIDDLAADVEELVDQSGDILLPDTSQKILAVFEAGKALARELEKAINKFDDVTKKRIRFLVKAYKTSAEVVGQIVAEITVMPGEDEGEEEQPAEAATAKAENDEEEGDDEDEDELEEGEDGDDEDDEEEPEDDDIAAGGDK